jgi:hypothetical protein
MRQLVLLTVGVGLFWLVVGVPARHLGGGDQALLDCGVALLLCLVPAGLTLVAVEWIGRNDPSTRVLVALGSTVFRLLVVLLGGWLATALVPALRHEGFWIWLGVCYLFCLALETALLLPARARTGDPSRDSRAGGLP